MKRRAVHVIKSRLEDIEVGDVVNRNPDAELGWFTVDAVSTLFNGHLQLADETEQLTVSGDHKDMVGLQLVEELILDDRGVIAPAAPVAPAAPAAPVAPAAPAAVAAPLAPAASAPPAASSPPVHTPDSIPSPTPAPSVLADERPVDLAAEAAAAAAVATEMSAASPSGAPGAPAGVDLALVASLLENLDVGEAPEISTQISDDPMMASAAPAIPAGAVAVDGGLLPDKPSYKNPIVVPEGTMLPRRGRTG